MKRRGIIQMVPRDSLKDFGELKIQDMYREFTSKPMLSYDEFKEFIEEIDYPHFDGVQLKADIRIVGAAEWSEIVYKAKQYDKMTKEADLW